MALWLLPLPGQSSWNPYHWFTSIVGPLYAAVRNNATDPIGKTLQLAGMAVAKAAPSTMGTLVATGKLRARESIAQGLAAAPEAFLGLLKGKNFGKQLVKLID